MQPVYRLVKPCFRFCAKCICLILFCVTESRADELVLSTGFSTPIQDISAQVLRKAYANIGLKVRIKRVPLARSLVLSNKGYFDGEVSRVEGIDSRYKNLVQIPEPINFIEGSAFAKSNELNILKWESLRPHSLVCVKGVEFIQHMLDKLMISCHYATTYLQAVSMLKHDRVELAILPRINGIGALEKLQIKDVQVVGHPLAKLPLYHYVHKKHEKIVSALHRELLKMKEDGQINAIRARSQFHLIN